tara:strand:+ start:308 stop:1264 length:957 start_codon:yes stop_codon:yes gene_type:complete
MFISCPVSVTANPFWRINGAVQSGKLSGDQILGDIKSDNAFGISLDLGYQVNLYKKESVTSAVKEYKRLTKFKVIIDGEEWDVFLHLKVKDKAGIEGDNIYIYRQEKKFPYDADVKLLQIRNQSTMLSEKAEKIEKKEIDALKKSNAKAIKIRMLSKTVFSKKISKTNEVTGVQVKPISQYYIQPLVTLGLYDDLLFKGQTLLGSEMHLLKVKRPISMSLEFGGWADSVRAHFGVFVGLSQLSYQVTDEYANFVSDTANGGQQWNFFWGLTFMSNIDADSRYGARLAFNNGSISALKTLDRNWNVSTTELTVYYQRKF